MRTINRKHLIFFTFITLIMSFLLSFSASGYPLFGSEDTQIGRLEMQRLIENGERRGAKQPNGGLLSLDQVDIRLQDKPEMNLPEPDAQLAREIRRFLGKNQSRYSLSVLDLTDPNAPVYAEHKATDRRNPGSVGKIMVALALFQALADAYPNDIDARKRVLRETRIIADEFITYDSHEVWLWLRESQKAPHRRLKIGDEGNLYEYLDWMLSASSNASASMVLKQALLLKQFGTEYPISDERANAFFNETPKKELSLLLLETIQTPMKRNGLDLEKLRQGSFFTRRGKHKVPGTNSYGNTRELMKLMLKMEQGKLVDTFSSREMKRLLYMTERRIRYASHPALKDSAVYFKSGSLYKCGEDADPDFKCKKYHGNILNLMNSVAIVETPAGGRHLHYIVTLNSNILRVNSAVAHQTLAMRIHRLLEKRHPMIEVPESVIEQPVTDVNEPLDERESTSP